MSLDGCVIQVDRSAVFTLKSSCNWISIVATGQKTVLDLDKYEIMHRVQIKARDLRILDPNLSYPCAILGRERAIVLNLEHIKMIITAKEVLLGDPSDENVIPVLEELQRRLPAVTEIYDGQGDAEADEFEEDESPFEFRALEVALEAICSFLAARTTELETSAYPALDELTSKMSGSNLDRVRKQKSAMTRLTARVTKLRDELEQLLDDDYDMADLYLSRKLVGETSLISASDEPKRHATLKKMGSKIARAKRADQDNDEKLEVLLEAYFKQIDNTFNRLTTLSEYIDDTEDYINIQLDHHQNELIQLKLIFRSVNVCVSMYSLIAAIFGMNIPFSWNNDHGYIFKLVVSLTGTFCSVLFTIILSYFRFKGHLVI